MNDKQLIERLRHCAACDDCAGCQDYEKEGCIEELMSNAADRISDLLIELRDERNWQDKGVEFELSQAEEMKIPLEELQYVIDCLPVTELLCQLAEEASELGKSALKLRRALDRTNPTPVSKEDAIKNLHEEIADVLLTLKTLGMDEGQLLVIYQEIMRKKTIRWAERLDKSITPDLVAVVRCKKCKWYREDDESCLFWPDKGYRHPEHFCDEGAKKNEN